jgi:hypothetical protein
VDSSRSLVEITGLMKVNTAFNALEISPIRKRSLRSKEKIIDKGKRIADTVMRLSLGHGIPLEPSSSTVNTVDSKILKHLKETLLSKTTYQEKIQLLTVAAAAELSAYRISLECGVSIYLAQRAKELFEEKGFLALPDPKKGKTLPEETLKLVNKFYLDDSISRQLPGKKDAVLVRAKDGTKEYIQKRLLLHTLSECYLLFKDDHTDVKIGKTKFSTLKPPQCVFPGTPGTREVCVCIIHGNADLVMEPICAYDLPDDRDPLSPTSCVLMTMCSPPSPYCCLGICQSCPGTAELEKYFQELLTGEDKVKYCIWTTQDRCELITVEKTTQAYIQTVISHLKLLRPHRFLVLMQNEFVNELTDNLEIGEVLCQGDYSENYSFFPPKAAQSYHWNNDQATVHMFLWCCTKT